MRFKKGRKLPPQTLGKIGVLMGGSSSERDVSLRSGNAIYQALKERGFAVEAIDIQSRNMREELSSHSLDFAFVALHGKGGEDGEIQSVLEQLGIPYLGSDSEVSSRAFNKIVAKKIFSEAGILTPPFAILSANDWEERLAHFGFPIFVKPPEEGSSIDVFCVEELTSLKKVVSYLFQKHSRLLAEKRIEGQEITVGIIGTRSLPVVEIRPRRFFYDYVAKYTPGMTKYIVPAEIPEAISQKVQEIALAAHHVLGLRDVSRIDMILQEEEAYVLEANTIPGFTETSLLPKAAQAAGLEFSDLCVELIRIALTRMEHEKESKGEKIFI